MSRRKEGPFDSKNASQKVLGSGASGISLDSAMSEGIMANLQFASVLIETAWGMDYLDKKGVGVSRLDE
ncbi:hypothetical protein BDBG_06305 [Blastomyces gilchristii SLH14081]|uniref:Uncharacterized protein n=1 Tax=Blastomyces gilchristii (strain SLH14081) TaxID=559298 RepID=A0A179UQU0_BLAGS|nr:uncharacterized protein BDBG_06305 [Blastomyces gilchristii SLH14081]OAT10466.1 hypothetical protein BDBG_06305 [Blastomyces gilchristii SLH14081]